MKKSKEKIVEDLELFRQYRESGDIEIRNKIIERNIPYAIYISKTYIGKYPIEGEDLISIATFGLIKAVDGYNPHKGVPFENFAFYCMRNELNMEIKKVKRRMNVDTVSFETSFINKKDGHSYAIADRFPSECDVEKDGINRAVVGELLDLAKKVLTEKEWRVIKSRFLREDFFNQREVSDELGICQSQISRLETSATKKLRENYDLFNAETGGFVKK